MTYSDKSLDVLPVTGLVALTQTAVGCGIGLLVAEKMEESTQKTTAIALLSLGLISTVSLAVGFAAKTWFGPGSERAARRQLRSIRNDSGLSEDVEIF